MFDLILDPSDSISVANGKAERCRRVGEIRNILRTNRQLPKAEWIIWAKGYIKWTKKWQEFFVKNR